ncbi:hypothetical protein K435DRAFT_837329 [Dendrothele bispora CBS 962.96]|uniref:L-ornithine N(5)-monooxygenase [NAD(P)H] n=1 Tax=Dendrothele bispora (strain CBS 962.96) TaxID=1314807 RepID=A0A4S8MDE3_DENBC|nr:hypothetical protein K435DRAFT_837329 [Dendrothele bispora CBS 962.96]
MCCDSTSPALYDLIGLGFGPSNIAIAGAIVERWGLPNTAQQNDDLSFKNVLFLEKHTSFQWHPGMLLPGAQMQISFMKDLATLRSPQSPITFLNYLHSQNRLAAFINRGSMTPSRKEFADYLGWAAKYVEKQGVEVNYGHQVIAIDEDSDGLILVTSKSVKDGREHVFKTRNLIISPGGSARIPSVVAPLLKEPSVIDRSTALHSSMYRTCRDRLFQSISSSSRPLRVAVIGGGQSAAEVAMNLRDCLSFIPAGDGSTGHQVDMIIRKGSLKPSDDTPFSNEVFDPDTTEIWFETNQAARERFKAEYNSTNYSVVNPRTIDQLYEVIYDQKVDSAIAARNQGASTPSPIINILPNSSIVSISHNSESKIFSFTILNTATRAVTENQKYDAIVCATGYARTSWVDLLRESKHLGKRFGVEASSSVDTPVRLVPFAPRIASEIDDPEPVLSPSSSGLHSPITPMTSSQPLTPVDGGDLDTKADVKVYISRKYRLLPLSSATSAKASDEGLKSRIYLQGMEESTHGLSDTLLSVMGIRAGEVVDDLFQED